MGALQRYLSAANALALDRDLMTIGGFSIDQLMELAGLSVSQVLHEVYNYKNGKNILIACGPGNNGGDGLVAARHLKHFGYQPKIFYPKRNNNDLFKRLVTQLEDLDIPFTNDFVAATKASDYVIDAIFGFSFSGEIREPFQAVITALEKTTLPVISVDVPSSWDVEKGPPLSGPGSNFNPTVLVSLSAPKPLASFFKGRHFLGGRFVPPKFQEKYGLEKYEYIGGSQILEIIDNSE
ncbi:NADH-hydrate epimerase [Erysiphe neolycopersici]|uniref:NAD(P)H-hydrate epimerase n=1 Tax=Erysiphe neolycopersici TaxID=212602 RepID=A0A420HL79_9PEZI|nr:NADH-hydrate epimerase [Erysiphe neolycopersici]